MEIEFLSPKISSRTVHSFSQSSEVMMISLRRSRVVLCNMSHSKPLMGNAKLGISTCSKFDNGGAVLSVYGKRKSGSTAPTRKPNKAIPKLSTKDRTETTSLVHSSNLQVLDRNMIPNFPKIESCRETQIFMGLGIVEFLKDKNFLITGATGFLAKVLIQKLLTVQPQVGKLFVIIKAKDYESALQRLKNEVICSDLFKCIQETHGNEYKKFMLKKLVPIIGDITGHDLGIQPDIAEELSEEVDIVFNCAGNTTFDERYDAALEINTKGTLHVLEFAKGCRKLELFLQISTAYVNGQRKGRVLEKPFQMGDTIARETAQLELLQSPPMLDIQAEFELANKTQKSNSSLLNSNGQGALDTGKHLVQTLKCLGIERAQTYGWQDTYVFTKAMGEMLIDNGREDLAVVIVRPSVIESTYSDPFPGWIEGNRMMDPVVLHYGKGKICGFLADPNGVLDVVPADMVVNATLAAMAKRAGKPGIDVYHVGSSVANPLIFRELTRAMTEHFKSDPYIGSNGKQVRLKEMQLFTDEDDFSTHMCSHVFNKLRNIESNVRSSSGMMLEKYKKKCAKSIEQAKYLAKIYRPYTFYQGRFDISNTEYLFQLLSEEEKQKFNFDVKKINWMDYISKTHIPGLQKHVMKGRGTKLE